MPVAKRIKPGSSPIGRASTSEASDALAGLPSRPGGQRRMLPTEPGGTSQNRSVVTRFSGAPVRLILDTDMGGGACRDVDDVVALCTLHAMMDNGEV